MIAEDVAEELHELLMDHAPKYMGDDAVIRWDETTQNIRDLMIAVATEFLDRHDLRSE